MTTEEKLKAYKEGFKDGFEEGYRRGREDGNLLNPYIPKDNNWTGCPVCGRTGITGVVCNFYGCPTRATTIGAAGSSTQSTMPTGANGPAGVW